MMSDDINHLFTTILPIQDNFSSLLLRSNASSSLNAAHSKMIQDETEAHNHHARQDNNIQFYLTNAIEIIYSFVFHLIVIENPLNTF